MPPLFEQVLVFVVMSILVAVFAWIYWLDRGREFGLWLVGWSAICIHFSGPLIAHFFPFLAPLANWTTVVALVVAGTFFRLSVSEVFHNPWQRVSFIVFVTLAATAYYTGLLFHVQAKWFYLALLTATGIAVLEHGLRTYGLRSRYVRVVAGILLPCWVWTEWQAVRGHYQQGMNLYLFGLFAVTGMAYLQRFRRLTPGVVYTVASFLAWGLVFPVSAWLGANDAEIPRFLWNLPTYFVAFGMIVTQLENRTEAATNTARQYQGLFEGNMAGVFVVTPGGVLQDCNRAFLRMYGFDSKEEVLSIPMAELYTDPAEWREFVSVLEREGQALNYESRQRGKNGSVLWHLTRASLVTKPGGRTVIEGTAIDITERKQADLSLRQSEHLFSTLFRGDLLACAILTIDGVFLDVNEAMLRTLAATPSDVIGKSGMRLGLWNSWYMRDLFYQRLQAEGSIHNLEADFTDVAGRRHVGLYFVTLVRVADHPCVFVMMLDQTETRELEARFQEAQKMEALGRLAGGVAHDFNNLLAVAESFAELLESKLRQDDDRRRYCTKIIDAVQRAADLTHQLLTFSRKEVSRPEPLHLGDAFRELAEFIPRLIGEDFELTLNLSAKGLVVMDKTHLEQVVFNIVINARDAMPNGGQLFIETEDVSRPALLPSGSMAASHYVAVRIRDTGAGMNDHTRRHAFEPFYTTKEPGRGTGLGLATVYGIVHQCAGEVSIDSQPGKGTQINILLPAVPGAASALPDKPGEEIETGTGRILLVEDETELRNASAEFLTLIGYSVVCAGNGPEALQLARDAGPIDLVISDVVMPKMSGGEFADGLRRLLPDAKLLFVSGYADDVVLSAGFASRGIPFLQKPFSLKQLGLKVNELLSLDKQGLAS